MELSATIFTGCAVSYALLTVWIGAKARRHSVLVLAFCCAVTTVWSGYTAWQGNLSFEGVSGALDFSRILAWYCYLLHLYRRSDVGTVSHIRAFTVVAVVAAIMGYGASFGHSGGPFGTQLSPDPLNLLSISVGSRLILSVCELLLIENLYLNLPETSRWHVAVPSVVLGGLACFDILLAADAVLYHRLSLPLAGARAATMVIVAPLLIIAASRGARWNYKIKLSRTAVFHSASLVLSGSVLIILAIAGELLRNLNQIWGWVAELSLVFAGVIGLVLFLSSRSGRSLINRTIVHHFFADQYDYRRQWLACIDTLSGTGSNERTALHTRAIRAVADVVDSPCGVFFMRDGGSGPFSWAGSWNMSSATQLPADHPIVLGAKGGEWIVNISKLDATVWATPPLEQLGKVWLSIPLLHSVGMIGLVLVGPPRVPFKTNQEVFDLLRILGREVATYINEQRATEVMLQTRDLHDYSKRFAFVAHDIKNVSSQLAMLLQNAEHHIANVEFQQDMLQTVQSSVRKIDGLLRRLEKPVTHVAPAAMAPVPRLETLLATYQRVRRATLSLEHDGSTGRVAISADAFDTAVTHLLNNAVEASPGQPVVVRVRHEAARILVEIIDHGAGMSPDFIRDQLFQPFSTHKPGGSGIGAFQARELLREAGAELVVKSREGIGTTMRIIFARADQVATGPRPSLSMAGGDGG